MDISDRLLGALLLPVAVLTASCGTTIEPDEAAAELGFVFVSPTAAMLPRPGDTITLQAIGRWSDGSEAPVEASWSTDDPSIAAIDPEGRASAVSSGVTLVRAASGAFVGVGTIAVDPDTVPPELVTARLERSRVDVARGPETVRFEAVFTDDRSRVREALAHFSGPLGPGITGVVAMERIDDTPEAMRFEGFLEVPSVGVGTWTLSILRATDAFGNSAQWGRRRLQARGLDIQLEVVALGG